MANIFDVLASDEALLDGGEYELEELRDQLVLRLADGEWDWEAGHYQSTHGFGSEADAKADFEEFLATIGDHEALRDAEVQRICREMNIAYRAAKAFLDPQYATLKVDQGQNAREVLAKTFVMAWAILATGYQPEVDHEVGAVRWCRGAISPNKSRSE